MRLRRAWGSAVTDGDRCLWLERTDAPGLDELKGKVEAALGRVSAAPPATEVADAFARLTSPFTDLVLGTSYGIAGEPPPGHAETAALVAAGRFDLLRAVLRGMNPEGRVWAAHALIAHQQRGGRLDPIDESAIDTLRKLSLELTVSRGCLVGRETFDGALKVIGD